MAARSQWLRSDEVRRVAPAWLAFLALGLGLFAYPFWLRVHGIAQDFFMMKDQVDAWNLVQVPFTGLPVTGGARTDGGYHPGAAFYWYLWLARVLVGRWFDNLPHTAGLAVSLLDAASFAALGSALWRTGVPLVAVLAVGLIAATVPYEAALARAAWNPNFALAMSNFALAGVLVWHRRPGMLRQAVVVACAWMAVQAHLSALPVAAGICTAMLLEGWLAKPRRTLRTASVIALVVIGLQLPRLLGGPVAGGAGNTVTDTALTRSFAALPSHPGVIIARGGFGFAAGEGTRLLLSVTPLEGFAVVVFLAAIAGLGLVIVRSKTEARAALLPLVAIAYAGLAYNLLPEPPKTYYLIPGLGVLLALFALAVGALDGVSPRAGAVVAWGLLALALYVQPARALYFRFDHRYEHYAAVVRGAREIARARVVIARAEGPDDHTLPTETTPLVIWLGGRVSPDAQTIARIGADGTVSYEAR